MKSLRTLLLGMVAVTVTAQASAGVIYNYERGAGVFGGGSGLSYEGVTASWDATNQLFEFIVDFDGTAADGGWLVVSPGANPKNSTTELAIAYLDADSGGVWVYAYNGANNAASYLETPFLGFFSNAYTIDGEGVATLSLNTSIIDTQLETGFAFGERLGIWYHPALGVNINGDASGMSGFSFSSQGWLDTNWDGDCDNPNNGCITTVPEPGTLPLVFLGCAMLALRRRLHGATV